MPANQRQQTAKSQVPSQPTTSPASRATAKYTNKDGSKFITVPKPLDATSAAMAQPGARSNDQAPLTPTGTNGTAPTVNRKKQKRRQKQAAKLAAEGLAAVRASSSHQNPDAHSRSQEHGYEESNEEHGQFDPAEGEAEYSDEEGSGSYGPTSPINGYVEPRMKKSKKKKKSRKPQLPEAPSHAPPHTNGFSNPNSSNPASLSIPPLSSSLPRGPGISREKIWNTSNDQERERIKEFWLSLGEDERKSLVKVEKDAVLKKMKEQQKHSCTCTVCGRKRIAIEEELEVLYDAYYEELEQYANHQGDIIPPIMPPPRRFGAVGGLQPPNRLPPAFISQQPSRGRIVEQLGDDEDEGEDEEYSDQDDIEDDEDDYASDEEPEPEELPRSSHAADFFNFGASLTVKGGILTVADDLLKNDGKKFIEMMEQLAERRMAREEDAEKQQSYSNYGHPPNGMHPQSMAHSHHYHSHPHSHSHPHPNPPPPEDDEYDDEEEEEDDEYDSQDEDYDEDELQDTMTEEQRMEEGRRMFQIFAARMFEQRVLTAYKEKVAKERQQQLLEELEEEKRTGEEKKAKKAKDAEKKKAKLAQKKQAAADERARKEAEKAAEEAALRAAEEKRLQEQRQKAEEKRKKKEAQKKQEEEERLRKENEKAKRLQELQEKKAEEERKKREAKEKERLQKEELRQREREAKETKEREAKERKERLERDRREREAKEQQQREEQIAQQAAARSAAHAATQAVKRPPVPIPVNLQAQPPATVVSPHIPVATPALPKAPTPTKLRTASQQESSASSSVPQTPQTGGISQNVSPVPSTPLQGSPGPAGGPSKQQNYPFLHQPQASSPIHSALKNAPPGIQQGAFGGMQPPNMSFPPPGMPMMPPGFGARPPHDMMFPQQPIGATFRPMVGPNGIGHPGMNMHPMQQSRGFPMQHPPPGFAQSPNSLGGIGQPFAKENVQLHSRNPSGSYDSPMVPGPPAQPIARPAPVGRPASVALGQRREENSNTDIDDLSGQLGSSALLDDDDEPPEIIPGRRHEQNFNSMPYGMQPSAFGSPIVPFQPWGGPPNPFGAPSMPVLPGTGWPGAWPQTGNPSMNANPSSLRQVQPRSVAIRLMICRACKNLDGSSPDRFYDIKDIQEQVSHMNQSNEAGPGAITEKDILDICETEGNSSNGGGFFDIRTDSSGRQSIRHETDLHLSQRSVHHPGDIGSPIVGSAPRFS